MITTVAVPTYRRQVSLARCLRALELQLELPSEVLVVVREDDLESRRLLSDFASGLNIRTVLVASGGLVAALNSVLDGARGDIIAITDDDAAPRSDWLCRITSRFSKDARIGAVGGRDVVHPVRSCGPGARTVGKVQWFGRVIGNHHEGVGRAREVEILKGVNMSFRRTAIRGTSFDDRLRGGGAQVHNDMAMSLVLRRRGWTLVYDPAIVVDHYPADRFGDDQRGHFDPCAVANAAHNETLVLLEYLPWLRRVAYMVWALLIGTKPVPGVAQLIRLLLTDPRLSFPRYMASLRGRWEGYRTWRGTATAARFRLPTPTARS